MADPDLKRDVIATLASHVNHRDPEVGKSATLGLVAVAKSADKRNKDIPALAVAPLAKAAKANNPKVAIPAMQALMAIASDKEASPKSRSEATRAVIGAAP